MKYVINNSRSQNLIKRFFILLLSFSLVLLVTSQIFYSLKPAGADSRTSLEGPKLLATPSIRGVDYGPFREGQSPEKGIFPTIQEMEEDMPLLKMMASTIRTYSVTNGFENIIGLGKKYGLKVVPGAWLSDNQAANEQEINNLIKVANQSDNVPFVVVGSEALLRWEKGWPGGLPENKLIEYITQVKQNVTVPVTTAEPWHIWLAHPNLVEAADFIFMNVHPYWEGITIDQAANFVLQKYTEVKDEYPAKRAAISETGWPSGGSPNGAAVPGLDNQEKFINNLLELANREAIDLFYFEAFDEGWKTSEPNGVGPHWGLYTSQRTPKHSITTFRKVERLWGMTSADTAIAISQRGFPGSKVALVARDDYFTDALAGGPLAKYVAYKNDFQAPILLTNTYELYTQTKAEIQRLGAERIYLLGGEGAVSFEVQKALGEIPGVKEVIRLWGETAYGTALAIKGEMAKISTETGSFPPDTAIITTGENFPDSLVISGPAASKNMPILLVKPFAKEPEPETKLALQGIETVIIVGGPGAVHPSLEGWLRRNGYQVLTRLWGQSEYDTAKAVLTEGDPIFNFDESTALVTRGDYFTDALAGGAFASTLGPAPMVLVKPDSIPLSTQLWLEGHKGDIQTIYVLGGWGAVSDTVMGQIEGIIK